MGKFTPITALVLAPTAALALYAGTTAAAAAPAALPTQASTPSATAPATTAQNGAVRTVTAFFDQYKSAVGGTNPSTNPREVRNKFLTAQLNARLDAWADEHSADPVFRAQNIPRDRSVSLEASNPRTTTVIVTQYWRGSDPTKVRYTVPTPGGKIIDIQDA
ncbi:hypothetical protein [Streptomyces sp. NBC_00872]|uniref:hypothetical protein n=1 Tax=Streptomyces sp. NBC_00872 TaxID=2903686 RepID=UPI003869C881|nr:hypothetical protein OG214_37370 [Streptomyces sp. NBC_00872]